MEDLPPISDAFEPPYYAVIFTSQRTDTEGEPYASTAERMVELAAEQDGFLGVESVRNPDGLGITVSYWSTMEAIAVWRAQSEHQQAQAKGRETWYAKYVVRVCKVERTYGFEMG
ncbi:MAG: antibiotic biosynthesis monooxygenase [Planctomycetota bacterium]